jgi:hypothetical protein
VLEHERLCGEVDAAAGLARMRQNENLFCKGRFVASHRHPTDGVAPSKLLMLSR